MCGRTACALTTNKIRRACRYTDRQTGRRQRPMWLSAPGGQHYAPSHNLAPGAFTPILFSGRHRPYKDAPAAERCIMPMMWGLVPHWHKGEPKEIAFNMNNCRSESMREKPSFRVPLERGQRCVVLADGFFEWKRDSGTKQPYYIYFPQNDNSTSETCNKSKLTDNKLEITDADTKCLSETKEKIADEEEEEDDDRDDDTDMTESSDRRLLTMAGVFDIWQPPDGSPALYTYSVITVASSPAISFIHHRMPALLTNDDEVASWLESGTVKLEKAVSLIRPVECIQTHPVSSFVNNSSHNSPECIQEIKLGVTAKPSASSNFMLNWLSKGKRQAQDTRDEKHHLEKKLKTDLPV